MLSKLIGYEMKAFGRILLPVYAAILAVAFILGIDFRIFSGSDQSAGSTVLTLILGLMIAAVFIVVGLLSIGRFYTNLLGREGYLMFSLPTSTGNLIWAKVISTVLWSIFSTVVALIACVIPVCMYPGFWKGAQEADFKVVGAEVSASLLKYAGNIVVGVLIVIAAVAATIVCIYAAIAIGHLWTEHRILGSLLAFIGLEILNSIFLGLAGTGAFAVGSYPDLNRAMIAGGTEAVILVLFAAEIALYGVITWVILDRKLNLE